MSASPSLMRSRALRAGSGKMGSNGLADLTKSLLALHRLGEIGEKFIGQFLGRSVDQPLAELGQLAADLSLDIVGQQSAAVLFSQCHRRPTLGEAGDTALALA